MNNKFPTISRSLIIFALLIVFTIILGKPIVFYSEKFDLINKDIATSLAYIFPLIATIYSSYVIIKRQKTESNITDNRSSANNDKKIFNFAIGHIDKYILIFLLSIVMIIWADFFTSLIPMPNWVKEMFKNAFNLSIPNILIITIFAPLLEEILVRGLVLRGYLKNYTPNKAIIASAIFFGIIHLNPWQFVAGFISGLVLGYLYYKTKSLTPSIFVHFVNNSLSVIFMIYYPESDATFKELFGNGTYYIALIISLALGYLIFKQLDKMLNKEYDSFLVKN